jgi:hypothetical protein
MSNKKGQRFSGLFYLFEFNTRNGPFFGMLLFATGYWLSSKNPTTRWFT